MMEKKQLSKKNKIVALILGAIALAWYLASMFTLWK